jgi:hypothetical protein
VLFFMITIYSVFNDHRVVSVFSVMNGLGSVVPNIV